MTRLGSHNGEGLRYAMHLSAPKGGVAQMLRDPEGAWVPYEEYARLKAEVERLTKELENTDCMFAMASAFARDWKAAKYAMDWNAAKEGKQP